jgi:hypothetical protein
VGAWSPCSPLASFSPIRGSPVSGSSAFNAAAPTRGACTSSNAAKSDSDYVDEEVAKDDDESSAPDKKKQKKEAKPARQVKKKKKKQQQESTGEHESTGELETTGEPALVEGSSKYTRIANVPDAFLRAEGADFAVALRAASDAHKQRNPKFKDLHDDLDKLFAKDRVDAPVWQGPISNPDYEVLTVQNLAMLFLSKDWLGTITIQGMCKAYYLLIYEGFPRTLASSANKKRVKTVDEEIWLRHHGMINCLVSEIQYRRTLQRKVETDKLMEDGREFRKRQAGTQELTDDGKSVQQGSSST